MRAFIWLAAAGISIVSIATPAFAEASDPGARLRALLEKRLTDDKAKAANPSFSARSLRRGITPPPASEAPKVVPREMLIITPKGDMRRAPATEAPNRRSSLEKPGDGITPTSSNPETPPATGIWEYLKSLWQPADVNASATTPLQADTGSAIAPRSAIRLAQTNKGRMREGTAFGVVPDTYIIQFKHTATNAQIEHVLKKYDLEIVGGLPALGLIYVKQRQFGTTRSISRETPAPSSEVLDPDFIKNIRKEPGINAATVQSTITPKSMPRDSSTMVEDGGKAYHWSWRPGVDNDGNWGLKRMRIPSLWRILKTTRNSDKPGKPAVMSFLDSGFSWHGHLKYNKVFGLKEGERLIAAGSTCQEAHGTHVAGIAGAAHGRGRGIDGIVPDAYIDAIPLQAEFVIHGMEAGIQGLGNQSAMLFTSAAGQLVEYLEQNPPAEGAKRVVNISLGFNWRAINDASNEAISSEIADGELVKEEKKTIVIMLARILQQSLKRFSDDTLFVIAAGNDSDKLDVPLNAKWSSPFSYLGLESSTTFERATNVLVVEAVDRSGNRAPFSNAGGHIAAPGVDVMSTIGGRGSNYAICEGTSQAAPHITALAAILMELAPDKTPAEIAEIIREAAVPDADGKTAPRADALEAILKARSDALDILADLNGDGIVNSDDLATYKRHNEAMTSVFQSTLGSYFFDLNENGQVEDNEHWYPRIDLNGSGHARSDASDKRCVGGKPVTDLGVIRLAWERKNEESFDQVATSLNLIDPRLTLVSSAQGRCGW